LGGTIFCLSPVIPFEESSASPVAISTMRLAHWFRSRGRLGGLVISAVSDVRVEPMCGIMFDPILSLIFRFEPAKLQGRRAVNDDLDIPTRTVFECSWAKFGFWF
jgi:hypothetical protein